jgi:hypothetical protein
VTAPRNPWLRVGLDAWSLGFEASTVIGLRAWKIAAGGAAADTEARRMCSEKLEAGIALQSIAITGGLGTSAPGAASKTISHYRRKVRAKSLHAKIGELTLENDFLEGALNKAGLLSAKR